MITSNSVISRVLVNLGRTDKRMAEITEQLSTGKKINAPKDDPVGWAAATRGANRFGSLQAVNASLNSVAMNVRTANNAMDSIGELTGQMKGLLETIVKNYPPYPAGSAERAELLQSFNGIRDQIDQLTLPADDYGARKLMADPAVFAEAGDLHVMTDDSGLRSTIHNRQVHTGANGLNIPPLPTNATDAEIDAAIANLDVARDTLRLRQTGLALDATGVERHIEINTKAAELNISFAEKIAAADIEEVAAELKSLELKTALSIAAIDSATNAQAQLLTLLK